jgi:signal transduction histidine kinase
VQEVWESLADRRANRDIEFRLSALPAARGDPRALRQIWQNLLENALKFSRDKTPAVIEVDAETDAQELRYRVRDNGAGFDPRYAHKLFGLFQRLHGMDEFDGTGVGLSIVQRLLRKHGGSIRGQGQPGAGASFEFTLPADPVAS